MSIRFGSACSGIEAASVAWAPLGWKAAWLTEIDPFASAVLARRHPAVANLGDMTRIARRVLTGEVEAPDVLAGGTPCQAFSVAGLRKSLGDARANLSLRFVELANAIDHVRSRRGEPECVVVWENVPGVLSTKDNAFGCFLAGLAGEDGPLRAPGKRWTDAGAVLGPRRAIAWRTLDAQYFGLAQRRRRVFVVASARNGFDPASVLFEWQSLRRDTAPSRAPRQAAAGTLAASAGKRRPEADSGQLVAGTLRAGGRCAGSATQQDAHAGMLVAFGGRNCRQTEVSTTLQAPSGGPRHDAESETFIAFDCKASGLAGFGIGDIASTLRAMGHAGAHGNGGGQLAVAMPILSPGRRSRRSIDDLRCGSDIGAEGDPMYTLAAERPHGVGAGLQVRRLTPRECERLQGFPDDYTLIPSWPGWRRMDADETPDSCRARGLDVRQSRKRGTWFVRDVDGPRYRVLGNSWAITVARWVGMRIDAALRRVAAEGRAPGGDFEDMAD